MIGPAGNWIRSIAVEEGELRIERLGTRWRIWWLAWHAPFAWLVGNITDAQLASFGDDPRA